MVQRVHKYADGGKVVKDKPVSRGTNATPGVKGAVKDLIGSVAGSTKVGQDLKSANKRREQELGLRNGGKVKRK